MSDESGFLRIDEVRLAEPVVEKRGQHSMRGVIIAAIGGAVIGALVVTVAAFMVFGTYVAKSGTGSSSSVASSANGISSGTTGAATTASSLSEQVAAKTLPSIVSINVIGATVDRMTGQSVASSSSGSGIIIRADGHIITNYHVIEGGTKITVTVGSKTYTATVVGTDSTTDLAVLKIDATGLSAVTIGSSQNLKVGQYVMAVGSPFGLNNSVSTGIISALGRSNMIADQTQISAYVNLIQTDAAVNPGNSGGALVDESGKLIGINTLISSTSGSSAGVGFAIPVDTVVDIADQLITTGRAQHPFLGVATQTINAQLAQYYNLKTASGAYVVTVSSGSPAQKTGMKVGDIIVAVAGTKVGSSEDLFTDVRMHKIGESVSITYYRDGRKKVARVTLASDTDVKTQSSTQQDATQQNK